MAIPAEHRFLEKFILSPDGCWLWTASQNGKGYGIFQPTTTVSIGAHRFAYEIFVGPIPKGLYLDHLCRVRNCVNPAHLEPVTNRENLRRGLRGDLRTHCSNGHEMTAENTNTMTTKQGTVRKCRACISSYNAKYARRRKAAGGLLSVLREVDQ